MMLGDQIATQLAPTDEAQYQAWRARLDKPLQYEGDYDLRGAYLNGAQATMMDDGKPHLTDLFKLPNHETFSNQSMYAPLDPAMAGDWSGPGHNEPPYKPTVLRFLLDAIRK